MAAGSGLCSLPPHLEPFNHRSFHHSLVSSQLVTQDSLMGERGLPFLVEAACETWACATRGPCFHCHGLVLPCRLPQLTHLEGPASEGSGGISSAWPLQFQWWRVDAVPLVRMDALPGAGCAAGRPGPGEKPRDVRAVCARGQLAALAQHGIRHFTRELVLLQKL